MYPTKNDLPEAMPGSPDRCGNPALERANAARD
jgi:hypothetical protein